MTETRSKKFHRDSPLLRESFAVEFVNILSFIKHFVSIHVETCGLLRYSARNVSGITDERCANFRHQKKTWNGANL